MVLTNTDKKHLKRKMVILADYIEELEITINHIKEIYEDIKMYIDDVLENERLD
jgi:hypothetical protein